MAPRTRQDDKTKSRERPRAVTRESRSGNGLLPVCIALSVPQPSLPVSSAVQAQLEPLSTLKCLLTPDLNEHPAVHAPGYASVTQPRLLLLSTRFLPSPGISQCSYLSKKENTSDNVPDVTTQAASCPLRTWVKPRFHGLSVKLFRVSEKSNPRPRTSGG